MMMLSQADRLQMCRPAKAFAADFQRGFVS